MAGLTVAFGVIAVAYTLVTLSPLTGGVWRQMERRAVATTADWTTAG